MKVAKLLHNPKAGDQDHSKNELIKLIESNGYKCIYASVKEDGWKEIEEEVDFLVVAGGDGTVRKAAKQLLKRGVMEKKYPIALLPTGTANNIGTSFNLTTKPEAVESWKHCKIQKFDVGKITGLEDESFFLEGFGFGVLPNLMKAMKKVDEAEIDTPEKSLATALDELLKTVKEYEARPCTLTLDGVDHSGKFLLVEVMNIRLVGPNLNLNPLADSGDGEFEVVIIPEDQRNKFANYVSDKIAGKEEPFCFSALKAKDIKITWEGVHAHVDDEVIRADKSIKVEVTIQPGVLDFIVPE